MAKSTLNMNLGFLFMATLSALSFAQQPPVQMPPAQFPPNGQLPPVQLPPNSQLPPVQLPPNSQLPPVQTPQTQTPTTQTCTPSATISSLAPCASYLAGNSSSPSSSCCTLLTSLLQSQTPCVCSVLKGGLNTVGYFFNQTQALSLPSICNMPTNPCTDETSTAPASTPNAVAPSVDEPATPTPVTAETPAPTVTPPATTTVPTKTPATGVKATPAAISGAIKSSGSMGTVIFLSTVIVASYMSS